MVEETRYIIYLSPPSCPFQIVNSIRFYKIQKFPQLPNQIYSTRPFPRKLIQRPIKPNQKKLINPLTNPQKSQKHCQKKFINMIEIPHIPQLTN
jgi:hypothetical protein